MFTPTMQSPGTRGQEEVVAVGSGALEQLLPGVFGREVLVEFAVGPVDDRGVLAVFVLGGAREFLRVSPTPSPAKTDE